MSLLARIRKNREFRVTVGKFTFICRRPTSVEIVPLCPMDVDGIRRLDNRLAAQNQVAGWECVTEDDVIGNGNADPAIFDIALWQEWCADRNDFWKPIGKACGAAFDAYALALEEAEKNS